MFFLAPNKKFCNMSKLKNVVVTENYLYWDTNGIFKIKYTSISIIMPSVEYPDFITKFSFSLANKLNKLSILNYFSKRLCYYEKEEACDL